MIVAIGFVSGALIGLVICAVVIALNSRGGPE
jgi:hypothetical protein